MKYDDDLGKLDVSFRRLIWVLDVSFRRLIVLPLSKNTMFFEPPKTEFLQ